MDTLTQINHIVDDVEQRNRSEEVKTPEFTYEVYIVGDDKAVTAAAVQLNKRCAAQKFVHVTEVNKLNLLRFVAPIKGIPVVAILKRLGIKTRANFPYDRTPKTNIRDSAEAPANEGSGPEAATEAPSTDVESPVLGDSGVLDSERQDVQNT